MAANILLSNAQLELSKNPTPDKQNETMRSISRGHIDSFNQMLHSSLDLAVSDLDDVVFDCMGHLVKASITSCSLKMPTISEGKGFQLQPKTYPDECRQRRVSYKSDFEIKIRIQIDSTVYDVVRNAGQVPVMVMSDACYLRDLTPRQLIDRHEEAQEMGGYFIVNGNEKILRMLLMTRRNHPICTIRPTYTNRGPGYTAYGVQMRCVRPDQTSHRLVLHYKSDGRCVLGFSHKKRQYLVPAIYLLRAFGGRSDSDIFNAIVQADTSNSFLVEKVKTLIREGTKGRYTQEQCMKFLGSKFKVLLELHHTTSDMEAAHVLFKRCIFVHIPADNMEAKYDILIAMIRRLYALVAGECRADNSDSQMNQELLLPGQIYGALLKEQMQEYLLSIKRILDVHVATGRHVDLSDFRYVTSRVLPACTDIGRAMEYFLATGNLKSRTGLDQMQTAGFTIIADKLNFLRYLSHFRCVHRGAYFAEMKTTAVRKLLPEAWGFLCPVHTPDGAPCGLLLHLSRHCIPQTSIVDTSGLVEVLHELGMVELSVRRPKVLLDVFIDGVVVGRCDVNKLKSLAATLRQLKVVGHADVPEVLEIGVVPPTRKGQYPGLYLFTNPCRMLRPVIHLATNKTEYISTFEQVYMDIAIDPEEGQIIQSSSNCRYTHMEPTKHGILSVVASFTPFSDFNQSPRNMYQCQMGKQTMGVPCQATKFRADNKLYCLNSGQSPIVRPRAYDEYGVDNFPTGNNAIVCVIAYTGYDMEDAMILNKSSVERGFMHARVLKTEVIDLIKEGKTSQCMKTFGLHIRDRNKLSAFLDGDGLPRVGVTLRAGDPYYSVLDHIEGGAKINRYKGEDAVVEKVALLESDSSSRMTPQRVSITLAINRNPIIGDKFASRAGQKGILSRLLPVEDLPFTESGMVPDLLFNPHGFPSRMTIGMLIESMAGKSGALHGAFHDATPFQFTEEETAVEYFGEQLRKAGYNYYGHERMYSGVTGEELEVDVFIGNVFYQRLRHMVSDKFQVRTTGPVDSKTHQPIKGRKRHGGIRFGEMERDALLGHGTSFLLHDRLVRCSDNSEAYICSKCGNMLSTASVALSTSNRIRKERCTYCEKSNVVRVSIPYVYRYLAAELASMSIHLNMDVKQI
eukprot:m.177015 g.177015  ORF g.177015 m.177015 type:complete len:1133 (-) comp13541_c0_seq10:42-3440(-)